ncbi:hypothetical protein [Streptomyces lavendulocolor]
MTVAVAAGCSVVATWYLVPDTEAFTGGRVERPPTAMSSRAS